MNRSDVMDLIVTTLRDLLAGDPARAGLPIEESTRLYGPEGLLDSLRLVSLVLDLEQEINARLDTAITIADSRAMSQQRSPFRSVGSLADYIVRLLAEEHQQAA
ncbi:MAG: acyl carrier protein [Oscillochloridaceae bacterium]|nr:acyl carrier protein [Chloroflexaceae bacterium]MDW8389232.1 acyl carrier protein [Oscillochloridaceae bacterium]